MDQQLNRGCDFTTRREIRHDIKLYLLIALIILAVNLIVGWMDAPTTARRAAHPASKMTVTAAAIRVAERRESQELVSLGAFKVFAYCPCERCCGRWSGMSLTASGTSPVAGVTIAADWSVLPSGATIYLEGIGWRTVEDTGAGIEGNKLDLFFDSHEAALKFGVRQVNVWKK